MLNELLVVAAQLLQSLWLVFHRVRGLSLCKIELERRKMWWKLLANCILKRGEAHSSIERIEHVLWLHCLATNKFRTWTVANQMGARSVRWRLGRDDVTSARENNEFEWIAWNFSRNFVCLSTEQLLL